MEIYRPVFDALERAGARYVVVGGVAVNLQGFLRLTVDLDLIVDLDPGEAVRAMDALGSIGLRPRVPVHIRDFADPEVRRRWLEEKGMVVFNLWDPSEPLRVVDVFTDHPVDFVALYERSELIDDGGLRVRVASIDDLISLKRISGRPEDMRDIEALVDVKEQRRDG